MRYLFSVVWDISCGRIDVETDMIYHNLNHLIIFILIKGELVAFQVLLKLLFREPFGLPKSNYSTGSAKSRITLNTVSNSVDSDFRINL